MKGTKSYLVIGISIALSLTIWGITSGVTSGKMQDRDLLFTTKIDKEAVALGEPIRVEFVLTNEGNKPVNVPNEGVESGSLKIYLAGEDGEYKEYLGSGWGRKRGTSVALQPGESHSYFATILWNGKPDVSHLNENAAEEALAGQIATQYALPIPGVYFIKGVSAISLDEKKSGFKPTRVVIKQPEGGDMEVWDQIKRNAKIALLMQDGTFYARNDEEKQ